VADGDVEDDVALAEDTPCPVAVGLSIVDRFGSAEN
jgi:hypothetical protein